MKIVIAIDSMKGCLSSAEAGCAAAGALAGHDVRVLNVSDGGEGMLPAFAEVTGARIIEVSVHDLMMRRRTARYGLTPHGVAIIETAEACGLTLLAPDERNPMRATSYGVGELIAHAIGMGARQFVVGLGGSGTSDSGTGMLRALIDTLGHGHGGMDGVLNGVLGQCRFTLACDVDNPLYGPNGAAHVFGPQKGATPQMVETLDERARCFADFSARHYARDCSQLPGAGAAGGLGYAFMQYLGAQTEPGAALLLRLAGADGLLEGADLAITGEGAADRQTLMGKLPWHVMQAARSHGVPAWLIAGRVADAGILLDSGFSRVMCINPPGLPLDEAMRKDVAKANIKATIERAMRERNL